MIIFSHIFKKWEVQMTIPLLDFKYRVRWYALDKHSGAVFTQNKNTVENNESYLVEPTSSEICLTESVLTNGIPVIESGNAEQIEEKSLNFIEPSDNILQ